MLEARDQAMQTPDEVRAAFLDRTRVLGPVRIEPFSLGILWLFESLKHPLYSGGKPILEDGKPVLDGKGKPKTEGLSIQDISRAIYIFHDSEGAAEALASGEEAFDAEAMSLVRGIEPASIGTILEEITKTLAEGLATIPGGGAANPA